MAFVCHKNFLSCPPTPPCYDHMEDYIRLNAFMNVNCDNQQIRVEYIRDKVDTYCYVTYLHVVLSNENKYC